MTDSSALFTRHAGNPLLSPERWPYSINAVMNAGAARVGDETVLLFNCANGNKYPLGDRARRLMLAEAQPRDL